MAKNKTANLSPKDENHLNDELVAKELLRRKRISESAKKRKAQQPTSPLPSTQHLPVEETLHDQPTQTTIQPTTHSRPSFGNNQRDLYIANLEQDIIDLNDQVLQLVELINRLQQRIKNSNTSASTDASQHIPS